MPEFRLDSINPPPSSNSSSPSSISTSSVVLFTHQPSDPPSPSSPPLWSHHHHPLRPTSSRSQVIARGRRELMEMLKNVPESAYELSLKDLVDWIPAENHKGEEEQRTTKARKKSGRNKGWDHHCLNGGGFMLKTFVPISYFGSKAKQSNPGRLSPKPLFMMEEKESENWEWWKKGFMVVRLGRNSSSGSSRFSKSSSSGASSSLSRHEDGFFSGCWSFLIHTRSKSINGD